MKLLITTPAPHIRSKDSTQSIMLDVVIALIPALVASVVLFGIQALMVTAVSVVAAVAAEFVFEKCVKKAVTISDLSAVVTGILLAFCLPADIPLWIAALGSIIAIVVVKQLFGGIGQNFANPAATARVVLLISFGGAMAPWSADSVSGATPLSGGAIPGLTGMLLGQHPGCLGETCAAALLIGGIYLLIRKVISRHIPVAYLGTVAVVSLLAGQDLTLQLLGGGLLLGAFFMATDYTTSPMTNEGKLVYGVGCGLLTMMIRLWGSTPEGVSYAILLMNILTPHIDKLTVHKALGGGGKA